MTNEQQIDGNLKYFKQYTKLKQANQANSEIVRTRISKLLDTEAGFIELSEFAGIDLYPGIQNSGIITGIGFVANKPCVIIANNPEIKAGCYFPITIKKTIRALEIALKQQLPCIHLVDSGGAYIPMQQEIFANADGFGKIFNLQAKLKHRGIAQYAAIFGSCTAGGAYIPVMADACIMLKDKASLFLAGPPLVEAATGEKLSAQELGGSKIHCYKSGVVDAEAKDENTAIQWLQNSISRIKFTANKIKHSNKNHTDPACYLESDSRYLPDINGIISTILDTPDFDEFQKNHAQTIRVGWGKIYGSDVAIIANDGILTSEAMQKTKNFIDVNNQLMQPILFIHNTHGMLVGSQAERSGIANYGAELIYAVSNTKSRKYTIMIGNSYGAGNYAMCGRAFEPDFLFQWPNNKTAVMGAKQQEFVLKYLGKDIKINSENHDAFYHSKLLNDDGIILPKDTRRLLGTLINLDRQELTTYD